MQLWYWRDRIKELISIEYPITRYCLDVQGNSLVLVSTFQNGEEESNPMLVDLQIAQEQVQNHRSGNMNTHVPFCDNVLVKPAELWIRWKSNPIAVPAFDVKYGQNTGFSEFDKRYRNGQSIELGQLTHTNSNCNDDFKVVLSAWVDEYGGMIGDNRLPVFFDMEQSANVLLLSSWYKCDDVSEDGIITKSEYGEQVKTVLCAKNPKHVVSLERGGSSTLDYCLEKYPSDVSISGTRTSLDWIFDKYHYCQANGSLLIPFYRFDCVDDGDSTQKLDLMAYVIPAQTIKGENYAAQERMYQLKLSEPIDLNQKIGFSSHASKRLFDHAMKVCRNTNLVFSTYNFNGSNRIKVAFLGVFSDGQDDHSYKVNSCGAKTRYEYDSQDTRSLALTKSRYFDATDEKWMEPDNDSWNQEVDGGMKRRYVDKGVLDAFNSYDSMDKYVFVLGFSPTIDNKGAFENGWMDGIEPSSYNILGDSGCIPHFAYQSLVEYDSGDSECGISFTWKNEFLKNRNHLQFELLGLDDKKIPEAFENMNRMVVDDLSDDCKTILRPAKMMDDIYRIWCCSKTMKDRLGNYPYDMYFENEYKDWVVEKNDSCSLQFEDGVAEWSPDESEDMFAIDLSTLENVPSQSDDQGSWSDEQIESFKNVLSEYYVSILRTDNGRIMNEKRYILPPTPVSEFLVSGDESGYVGCKLSRYLTASVKDNHHAKASVVFTGTQPPFEVDESGSRTYALPEELQYGNSICGVEQIQMKIDIVDVEVKTQAWKDDFTPMLDEDGNKVEVSHFVKKLKPVLRFKKFSGNPSSLVDKIQASTTQVPDGQVIVIMSHRNLDNLAKYHILNKSSNLYYMGSIPGRDNIFKTSDFKFSKTVFLDFDGQSNVWKSREVSWSGEPILRFQLNDVRGTDRLPPYWVEVDGDKWYLEQSELVEDGERSFQFGDTQNVLYHDNNGGKEQPGRNDNGNVYPKPGMGKFIYAHKVKEVPEKYADYLYIKSGGLAFKISEESQSFSEALTKIPPFHVDEKMKNKLQDLNNVKVMKEYSTFIHQSEDPDKVKDCRNFNPISIDAVLKHGLEQREGGQTK